MCRIIFFVCYIKRFLFPSLRFSLLSWISIKIAINWSCTSVTWPHYVKSETQSYCRTLPRPLLITAPTLPLGIRSCTAWRMNRWEAGVRLCVRQIKSNVFCFKCVREKKGGKKKGKSGKKWGHFVTPRALVSETILIECFCACFTCCIWWRVWVCVSVWMCVGAWGIHWLAWQVFGTAFHFTEKIYSSRSPDDRGLAAEQILVQIFYFTVQRVNSASSFWQQKKSWFICCTEQEEVSLFFYKKHHFLTFWKRAKRRGIKTEKEEVGLGKADM